MKKLVTMLMVLVVLALCSVTQAWTPPQPVVSGINTSNHETLPFLSNDGKTLYFTRSGSYWEIYQATRAGASGPFTSVTKALAHGSEYHVIGPWVSPDNLRMYYHSESSQWRLRVSTRASVSDPWTAGTVISGLSSFNAPQTPKLSQDELTIVFGAASTDGGSGGYDLWIATRLDTSSSFGSIRNLSEINSTASDGSPFLAPDGLALYFNSIRNGTNQLFKATRASLSDPFGNLEHLSFFDSTYGVSAPSLSADGSILFFAKGNSDGTSDIYFSEIPEPATLFLFGLSALVLRKKK